MALPNRAWHGSENLVQIREERNEHQEHEKNYRQHERPVNDLALVQQMHEKQCDERPLDYRDDQRDRYSELRGKLEVRHANGNDRQHHQRAENHVVGLDMAANVVVSGVRVHLSSVNRSPLTVYSRYKTGNRKIQTRSTKCQYRPAISMRFVNRSFAVFHIFAPGPHRYVFTMMPPT